MASNEWDLVWPGRQKAIPAADKVVKEKGPMIPSNPSRRQSFSAQFSMILSLGFLVAAASVILPVSQACAQAIIATVNGDPITDIDLEQRMKLLRVLRQPATHDAALESMIEDQLKLDETDKFKIKASTSEIGQQIGKVAGEMKMTPEALLTAIQTVGISESHFKDHFAADYQFNLLVQAYNKGIEASESQVREELAKDGGKGAAGIDYKVQQVIFTILDSTNPAATEAKMKAAAQLRTRFTDCDSGLDLARSTEDVAVKEMITRNSLQLSEGLKQLLEKTPVGHLTPPQRTVDGIEMIAVCSKDLSDDDTALRNAISQKLLAAEIDADAAKRLKEMRSYAVVVVKK
jgi:peptidyl-prolyl cis-trans isomerase SurA